MVGLLNRIIKTGIIIIWLIILVLCSSGCGDSQVIYLQGYVASGNAVAGSNEKREDKSVADDIAVNTSKKSETNIEDIPIYNGTAYTLLNGNQPYFTEGEINTKPLEEFSDLDQLGRCGSAIANVSKETMPTEERGPIGSVRPSGWHTVKYNDIIEGNYLYNRCHLIGYQLTGENANEKNLITGTRYLNTEGMLPFENEVLSYIDETNNHVLYRVTPVFEGDNLLASGVTMEAISVEDRGKGLSFNVFVFNVQPGIVINYENGDSEIDLDYGNQTRGTSEEDTETIEKYVLNKNTHKFHRPSCESVDDMKEKNKIISYGDREDLLEQGYEPCKRCNP